MLPRQFDRLQDFTEGEAAFCVFEIACCKISATQKQGWYLPLLVSYFPPFNSSGLLFIGLHAHIPTKLIQLHRPCCPAQPFLSLLCSLTCCFSSSCSKTTGLGARGPLEAPFGVHFVSLMQHLYFFEADSLSICVREPARGLMKTLYYGFLARLIENLMIKAKLPPGTRITRTGIIKGLQPLS